MRRVFKGKTRAQTAWTVTFAVLGLICLVTNPPGTVIFWVIAFLIYRRQPRLADPNEAWKRQWGQVAGEGAESRIERAKRMEFTVVEVNEVRRSAQFASDRGAEHYYTTFKSCSCPDFQKRHVPCKHMYYLAMKCGVKEL